jgi:hypothetical protein
MEEEVEKEEELLVTEIVLELTFPLIPPLPCARFSNIIVATDEGTEEAIELGVNIGFNGLMEVCEVTTVAEETEPEGLTV